MTFSSSRLSKPFTFYWIKCGFWLNSYLKRGKFRSFTDFWSNQIRDFHNRKKVVLGFTARCSCVKWNWRNLYFAHFMIYLKPMKSRPGVGNVRQAIICIISPSIAVLTMVSYVLRVWELPRGVKPPGHWTPNQQWIAHLSWLGLTQQNIIRSRNLTSFILVVKIRTHSTQKSIILQHWE